MPEYALKSEAGLAAFLFHSRRIFPQEEQIDE